MAGSRYCHGSHGLLPFQSTSSTATLCLADQADNNENVRMLDIAVELNFEYALVLCALIFLVQLVYEADICNSGRFVSVFCRQ